MMAGMTAHARKLRTAQHKKSLKKWQIAVVATLIALIALGLAVYAAAASYESVSGAAASHGVPLPRLNPLGLDGGLFGVILIDIALTLASKPIGWLRLVARLFAVGTIAANAAAGWPDPVSMGLRVAAPALLVIIVEVVRVILLRRNRDAGKGDSEGIPPGRWLLAPVQTFALWRRMKLWRIRSYSEAVEMDLSRRKAIVRLGAFYAGRDWREAAPADLVWMLRNGVHLDEALARVAELTKPPEPEVQPEVPARRSPRNKVRGSGQKRTASSPPKRRAVSPPEPEVPDDFDTQAEALRILAEEPGISGSALGLRLGKTKRYGCILKARLAASVAGPETR